MKIYTKENHENLSTLALVNLITISLTVISVISVILFAANSIWKEKLDSTLVGMPHTFETRETGRETGSVGGPYLPYPNTDPAALPGSNLLDSVDRVLASMKWATIAFNAPERINLKDRAQIQLLLSLQKSMDELRSEIVAAGRREGEKIQVSNQMEAHLSSQEGSFNIVKIAPEEQAVGSIGTFEWRWEVEPLAPGIHVLYLNLTAHFRIAGVATRKSIRTFEKKIEVEVTALQWVLRFIEKNWQWLWGAIILPATPWLSFIAWRRWKRPKGRRIRRNSRKAE